MSKNYLIAAPSTVRLVVKLPLSTAEKVRKIPAKKRSKFVEEAVLKKFADDNKIYAFQHMMNVKRGLKESESVNSIVGILRKDRHSH